MIFWGGGREESNSILISFQQELIYLFVAVGKELLCLAEASRDYSALQYMVDFKMNKHYVGFQMGVLLVLGKKADFRTGGSTTHAPPSISKGIWCVYCS